MHYAYSKNAHAPIRKKAINWFDIILEKKKKKNRREVGRGRWLQNN